MGFENDMECENDANLINYSSFEFGAEKRRSPQPQKKQKQMTPNVHIQKTQPTSLLPKPSPIPQSFLPQPSPIPRSPFPSPSFSQLSSAQPNHLDEWSIESLALLSPVDIDTSATQLSKQNHEELHAIFGNIKKQKFRIHDDSYVEDECSIEDINDSTFLDHSHASLATPPYLSQPQPPTKVDAGTQTEISYATHLKQWFESNQDCNDQSIAENETNSIKQDTDPDYFDVPLEPISPPSSPKSAKQNPQNIIPFSPIPAFSLSSIPTTPANAVNLPSFAMGSEETEQKYPELPSLLLSPVHNSVCLSMSKKLSRSLSSAQVSFFSIDADSVPRFPPPTEQSTFLQPTRREYQQENSTFNNISSTEVDYGTEKDEAELLNTDYTERWNRLWELLNTMKAKYPLPSN